jgi:hypothetical protein
MQKQIFAAILALILPAAGNAAADEPARAGEMQWFVGLGITHGGDKLAEVEVEFDGDREDENIRAGDLLSLAAGTVVYLPRSPVSIQASIGYHVDFVSADNGDVEFDRYPFEFIPFYNFGNHRLGSGVSYHLSPELDLGDAGGPKVEFKDAAGWLVEYDYSFSGWRNGGLVLGARYMWIDYKVDKVDGERVDGFRFDGNHFGIHADFMF